MLNHRSVWTLVTVVHVCTSWWSFSTAQRIPEGAERQEILDAHNRARRETAAARNVADMPELVWSDYAAEHGRDYLASISCTTFAHSDSYGRSPPLGENIAFGQSSWTAVIYDAWHASEIECYDQFAPSWQSCSGCQCGHFTAVNWADTTSVGCAVCERSNGQPYYTCNYGDSAPNFIGQQPFADDSGAPCSACPDAFPNCVNGLCSASASSGTSPGDGTSPNPNPDNPGGVDVGSGTGSGSTLGGGSSGDGSTLSVGASVGIALVVVLVVGIGATLAYNLWWKKRSGGPA